MIGVLLTATSDMPDVCERSDEEGGITLTATPVST